MIIENTNSNVTVLGDVTQFKTSINPKNIDFITTLLSSNLYSHPEQSFIREIVSNAWDSHIEAHHEDKPIIIKFEKNYQSKSKITIRDFGTGLSPERFKTIFCNIGSSTKRESNDYIGAWGLGRFSSLACTNTVQLVSYYEGIKRTYVMIKDANTITITLLNTEETDEQNGLEMTIEVKSIDKYEDALDKIVFFPNIYVTGISYATKINSVNFKEGKYYKACSIRTADKLLIGNVLYPLDKSGLSSEATRFIERIAYSGIVIKFNIGELPIIPNREAVIYNKASISLIEERILLAKAEINNHVQTLVKPDYNNLAEFLTFTTQPLRWDYMNDCLVLNSNTVSISVEPVFKKSTYRGLSIPRSYVLKYLCQTWTPFEKGVAINDRFCTKQSNATSAVFDDIAHRKTIILKGVKQISKFLKSYLAGHQNAIIMMDTPKEDYVAYFAANKTDPFEKEEYTLYANIAYDWIYEKAEILDPQLDPYYLKYLENIRPEKEYLTNISVYYYSNHNADGRISFADMNQLLCWLKSRKEGVLLVSRGDIGLYSTLAAVRNFCMVAANKQIRKEILKYNLSNVRTPDYFLNEDKKTSKIYTVLKYLKNDLTSECWHFLVHYLPEFETEKYKEVLCIWFDYYNKDIMWNDYNKEDPLIKNEVLELLNFTKIFNKVQLMLRPYKLQYIAYNSASLTNSFTVAMIKELNCIKLNYQAMREIKYNRIINYKHYAKEINTD